MSTAESFIVSNPVSSSGSSKNTNLKQRLKKNMAKIIFGVLGVVILVEVIMGINTLTKKSVVVTKNSTNIVSLSDGKIVLAKSKNNYNVGETVPINVRVVTGGRSADSVDLILHYDSKVLEASEKSIVLGKIYKDYPVSEVDQKTGIVAISGITLPKEPGFVGIGNFATVNFKALTAGSTNVTVEFKPGATVDSNIVLTGTTKDILNQVVNESINIGSGSNTAEQSAANSCDGYNQYCELSNGRSGRQYCKAGVVKNNQCAFDPQLTVSCSICSDK